MKRYLFEYEGGKNNFNGCELYIEKWSFVIVANDYNHAQRQVDERKHLGFFGKQPDYVKMTGVKKLEIQ